MVNIAVVGCTGKFGSCIAKNIISRDDVNLKYAIGRKGNHYIGSDISNIIGGHDRGVVIIDDIENADDCDVFIECTNTNAFLNENMQKYRKMNKPVTIATTAFSETEKKAIFELSEQIPVFMTGNFSIALYDFIETIKFAVKRINKDTDVQIVEYHHNQKKDAPSGTAIMIREALIKANGNINTEKINIYSVRGGNIFGEHEVIFANCNDEVITYKHQVSSRKAFSDGAIAAATWLTTRKCGMYDMTDFCEKNGQS